ncbi:hypothetical protein F7Q92_02165 [Ideonella dechloratans]|uniref:Uncharacterized protein n=1 Tax=Ideonella dechloratans TaxID=36863 RepID=A0A643FHL2_IDEDE|nr:hypothetical protein [Ideonella dechloratans]KAB0584981.1 hypothetical protein F7Q92_02165 [Ideonella dechloratans]UFU11508.1 hypothetical protein LRM40_07530 [Ideonella dechloratans]
MNNKPIESIFQILATHREGLEAVRSGQSFIPLLALLEYPLQQVQSTISSALAIVGLSRQEIDRASVEHITLFALTKDDLSTYWGTLAITWLEQGLHINEPLATALERVAQNKRFSQADRHRAFALAKRWQRTPNSHQDH